MIKLTKPKFWDNKKSSLISTLLLPASMITLLFIYLKKIIIKEKKFKIPIICVGNIYVGGTGKTPASILIANELVKLGFKPVIIRKYYKSHLDEFKLIEKNFNNLLISKTRKEGIINAQKKNFNIVVLDDGLQDYGIKKDLSIVCFHHDQLIGNGHLLPSGPLREKLNALKNVDFVLINGERNQKFEQKILKFNNKLKIFYSKYEPLNLDEFKNYNLLALAGIANPNNFFSLLEKNKLNIKERIILPDHYVFTKNELQNIIVKANQKKLKIIMTEKDFFKTNHFGLSGLNYLKVLLKVKNQEKFIDEFKKLNDKIY